MIIMDQDWMFSICVALYWSGCDSEFVRLLEMNVFLILVLDIEGYVWLCNCDDISEKCDTGHLQTM